MNDEVECIPIGIGAQYWFQTENGDWIVKTNRGEIQYLIIRSYLTDLENGFKLLFGRDAE